MAKKEYLIYGLIDPRTDLIRYVGKSSSGLNRPRQHRKDPVTQTTYCARWIGSLQQQGLDIQITILEKTTAETLSEAERWWIAYGRLSEWPLTNLTDGGEGAPGYCPPEDTRRKMSLASKGKPKSEEHRAAIGAGNRRRWMSQEARDTLARKLRGRKRSAETCARIGRASSGRKHTEETRRRIAESMTGKRPSPEAIAKTTAALYGRRVSEETRAKHRANALAQWAKRREAEEAQGEETWT